MEYVDEIIRGIEATAQNDKKKQAEKRRWQQERPDGAAIDMPLKKTNLTFIEYKPRSETWPDYRDL